MIRSLIQEQLNQKGANNNHSQGSSSVCLHPNRSSPIRQIKLGHHRKRLATLQPQFIMEQKLSVKIADTDTSLLQRTQLAHLEQEINVTRSNIKRIKIDVRQQKQKSTKGSYGNLILTNVLEGCLESQRKDEQKGKTTHRQIVKLRHPRNKLISPIDKLIRLMNDSVTDKMIAKKIFF